MGEIINIQVGQCGNQIGCKFWEQICEEHGISPTGAYIGDSDLQLEKISTFYNESMDFKYQPRVIQTDLEPSTKDQIKSSPINILYKTDNFIMGQTGAGNNWAKGYYTEGAELIDSLLDVVREEVEICDHMQGFEIFHGLAGGTGSGMGTLLISKLREEFPNKKIISISVFPGPILDSVVPPYNCTLSMHQLIEETDAVFVLDNNSLYRICFETLKLSTPSYGNLNHIISNAISNITAPLRFSLETNPSLCSITNYLIPFPRLHFLILGMTPILPRGTIQSSSNTIQDIGNHLFDLKYTLCETISIKQPAIITAYATFRGRIKEYFYHRAESIQEQIYNLIYIKSAYFLEGIPNNMRVDILDNLPIKDIKLGSILISNSVGVVGMFNKIGKQFTAMFRRKAFLHWYTGEGMDEMEFTEAHSNMNDLATEYVECLN